MHLKNKMNFLMSELRKKSLENHIVQGLLAFFSPSASHMKLCQNPKCYIKGPQTF